MPLPAGFTFSQASLQDYADCPRRFQLRYVLKVRWPIAREDSAAQWERRAQLGAAFHRMAQQHAVGISERAIAGTLTDPERTKGVRLIRWWSNYLQSPPAGMPAKDTPGVQHLPEVRLTTPLGGRCRPKPTAPHQCGRRTSDSTRYRLMARYDLLAIEPGKRAVIVDWKTNERRPERTHLETRWQTRVYRYLLVAAGAQLNHNVPWAPEQVELIYWFANYPAQPERFPYDDAQYTEDERALKAAIAEIAARIQHTEREANTLRPMEIGRKRSLVRGMQSEEWTLTDDLRRCRYCTYRTLCGREKTDAVEPEWEPDDRGALDGDEPHALQVDLEQIAEIEF